MTSNPLIAYKSNALVEASYKLTLQEQRFLLLCISRLNSGTDVASPELQKTMTITAAEYFDSFPDMGRKNAEVQLQEAIDRLWDRSIILKDDEKREEFRWIQYRAQYARGEGKAQITFSDAVMPYLTQLKGQFTRVVIKNISNLSRSYSIRIYEILQQFRSTGERIIALDDFKSSLMLDGKYKDFKTLNRDLIKPC
ncbi:replication initiation protein, partial [Salmonella enterica subsp. enterica serovar Newport]